MKKQNHQGQFNLFEGEVLKIEGQAQAVSHRGKMVHIAREIAKTVAQARPDREITIDAVYAVLIKSGYNPKALGMAAGSVFKENCWKFTGKMKKSERVSNHARPVQVWRLE